MPSHGCRHKFCTPIQKLYHTKEESHFRQQLSPPTGPDRCQMPISTCVPFLEAPWDASKSPLSEIKKVFKKGRERNKVF